MIGHYTTGLRFTRPAFTLRDSIEPNRRNALERFETRQSLVTSAATSSSPQTSSSASKQSGH